MTCKIAADEEQQRIIYANARFLAALEATGYGRTIGKQVVRQLVLPAFTIGVLAGWLVAKYFA